MGEQALKGYAQPTRAYRIVGVSEATSRFEAATQERLTPLVGREQELGLLLDRWALAQDGEGQVVLLSGEPGIGKSRILIALRDRLDARGAQALRFQCSPSIPPEASPGPTKAQGHGTHRISDVRCRSADGGASRSGQ